jgi:hypothetical protein
MEKNRKTKLPDSDVNVRRGSTQIVPRYVQVLDWN